MKPFVWKEGMTDEEAKNGAYWERNMLALYIGILDNLYWGDDPKRIECGWYVHGEYEGWSRVISLFNGKVTFHVPDDFDLGRLPQIEPNWDGHTTEEKWRQVMLSCGIRPKGIESTASLSPLGGGRPSKSSTGLMLTETEAYGNDCPSGNCEV